MMVILKEAINSRKLVQFYYKGNLRVVEPYTVGDSNTGNLSLRAWHLRGFSKSGDYPRWRLFHAKEMRSLTVLDDTFEGPRPGYNPPDSAMRIVYATY
jgi:predicted DNA-binding transcriptional regulator YafY